jgi:hypothetical protein
MTKGVYFSNNKWLAKIWYDKKLMSLGSFISKEEAIHARELAQQMKECGNLKDYRKPARTLTLRQNSIIVGSLLGDGSLNRPQKETHNSFFTKKQASKRLEYLNWHFEELQPFSRGICSGTGKSPHYPDRITQNSRYYTKAEELFTDIRQKWYPEGDKIVPKDIVLDPLSVAIWFADDGVNSRGRCWFCTDSFQEEDRLFLVQSLENLGISAFDSPKKKHVKIRARSYKDFIHMISPHFLWECFSYKAETKSRTRLSL